MEDKNYEAIIEAILFTMGDSVELDKIADAIDLDKKQTKDILEKMMEHYEDPSIGVRIIELDGAYQMCTKAEMYEYLIKIAKQPKKRVLTDVLLEMHIAAEESKQGFVEEEVLEIMFANTSYRGVRICGLMGMASHVDDEAAIDADFSRIEDFFHYLKDLFPELECFRELSIGMSSDWEIAVSHSASIVRIGTAIFGDKE